MPEAATQIGVVTIAYGSATAEGSEGIRTLTANAPVYADEVIKTTGEGSAVEIKLSDGAVLSQGPDSSIVLDDYIFDPDQSAGEMTIQLIQGTLRSVTGEIVDNNPEGFKIETPLATIGIRGTTTGHVVGANGEEEHVVVDFVDRAVVIGQSDGGLRVITQDGLGVSASGSGLSTVRPAPASILANLEQLSSDSMQQGAPTFRGDDTGQEEQQAQEEEASAEDGDAADGQDGGEGEGEGAEQAQAQAQGQAPAQPVQAQGLGLSAPAAVAPPVAAPVAPAPVAPQPAPVVTPVATTTVQPVEVVQEVQAEEETVQTIVISTTLDLSDSTDALTVDLSSTPSTVEKTGNPASRYTINDNYRNIVGSETHSNIITGDERWNTLTGSTDTDTIMGGGGKDVIIGMGGGDSLDGGGGVEDMVSYEGLLAGVDLSLSANTADYTYAIWDGGVVTVTPYTDTIENFERATGTSYNDTLWGDSNDNLLYGGEGNDLLWGASGEDSLRGNEGNDTFKFHEDLYGSIKGGEDNDVLQAWSDGTFDITGLTFVQGVENFNFKTSNTEVVLQATDFDVFDGIFSFELDSTNVSTNEILEIKSSADEIGETETIDMSQWTYGTNWSSGTGTLKVSGDIGNEFIDMGTGMTPHVAIDGGDGDDTLAFTDSGIEDNELTQMVNIETIVLGDADTSIRTQCSNVALGETLTVDGRAIQSGHTLTFNGSSETDSHFVIYGAEGKNVLTGGSLDDTFVLSTDLETGSNLNGGGGTNTLQIDGDVAIDSTNTINNLELIELTDGSTLTIQWDDMTLYQDASDITGTTGGLTETVSIVETSDGDVHLDLTAGEPDFYDWTGNKLEVIGGDGNNNIVAADIATHISGGDGNDSIGGGDGDDTIFGGNGEDQMGGGDGNDFLYGGAGDDTLWAAGNGDDYLVGGDGDDQIVGGSGNDTFAYTAASHGGDGILDFTAGDDSFLIQNITGLADGTLDSANFAIYDTGQDYDGDEGLLAGEGFIYEVVDATRGQLWYDDDTDSLGGEVLIANITQAVAGPTGSVEAADIEIA